MCDAGCVACPAGLRCPQGLGPPEQHGGFWAQPGARACSPSVWRCRNAEECPAGPLGSCSSGREGPACSNCIGGHHSAGSTCEACKQGDVLLAILLIIVLLLLLYAVSISRLDIGQVSSPLARRSRFRASGRLPRLEHRDGSFGDESTHHGDSSSGLYPRAQH